MTGQADQNHAPRRDSPWIAAAGGVLGSLWLLVWFGYIFLTMYPTLSLVGKSILSALCISGVAFAINGVTPPLIGRPIRPEEVGHPWTFVRAPRPDDPVLRSLQRKYRRGLVFATSIALCMLAWGIAVSFNLMKAR